MTIHEEKNIIEVRKKMKEAFGYKNDMAVPRVLKIVVNTGLGRMSQRPNFEDKVLPEVSRELGLIAGQKPSPRAAKKSIATFKTRAGQTIGLAVTLRGKRMYDFLNRLVKIVLPRVKDFRGIDLKNVDKNGNLTVGIKEHYAFPEIDPQTSKFDFGLEVTIVTNAKNREEAIELYRLLGIPLKK